ncbi:hypothetical protein NITHO_1040008 [Nitrolancea hollandica Lb]|uniref:Uncharacterized protein n=1 Tax=Nitrolancea hollandica Lb TaxID=1129897 RepID=I4ECH3_9BACT|nr:hypothetical protein NITHO_1040008 [Nitrolancea hollandica Lb]
MVAGQVAELGSSTTLTLIRQRVISRGKRISDMVLVVDAQSGNQGVALDQPQEGLAGREAILPSFGAYLAGLPTSDGLTGRSTRFMLRAKCEGVFAPEAVAFRVIPLLAMS